MCRIIGELRRSLVGGLIGESFYECDVAFQKIVGGQVSPILPDDLFELEIYGVSREIRHLVEFEENFGAVGIMDGLRVDDGADLRINLQFFAEFAGQCGWGIFAGFDFASGEFPFEGMAATGFSLADQDAPISFDHRGYDLHLAIIEARNG